MMYKNPFGYSKYIQKDYKKQQSAKILHGTFLPTSNKPPRLISSKQLRTKNVDTDKYLADSNDFKSFLKDEQKELPRLSILENYKQITRIMTASYIKAED
jgi:hypothetical protein